MAEENKLSRRGFVKSVAATAGAAALPSYATAQATAPQTPAPVAPLSLRNASQFPGLTHARRRLASIPVGKSDDERRLERGGHSASMVGSIHLTRCPELRPFRSVVLRLRTAAHGGSDAGLARGLRQDRGRTGQSLSHLLGRDRLVHADRRRPEARQLSAADHGPDSAGACAASTTASAGPPTGSSRGDCSPIQSAPTAICSFVRGSCCCWPPTSTSPATTSGRGRSR